ncbi:MAG: amidohydrolase family protein, partial [Candidatus Bathyarchaeia archaeon]
MQRAEIVIVNANVVTLDAERPRAEAVAIRDGRIVAVGSYAEVQKYINSGTKVLDFKGKTVVPGFVDCHVHMTGLGQQHLKTLDLRNVDSIEEMKRKIREYADRHPEKSWILGGRWDHERFSEKRLPTRWDLDEAVSDKPVFLIRVCGHIGVANTKALKLAGIGRETTVDGGSVDKDAASGEPNGILRENALDLVWKVIPKPILTELE